MCSISVVPSVRIVGVVGCVVSTPGELESSLVVLDGWWELCSGSLCVVKPSVPVEALSVVVPGERGWSAFEKKYVKT